MKQALFDYYLETGVGVGAGILFGKGVSLWDEAIYGGEVGIETGISGRLSAFMRNYWKFSGGLSQETAEQIVRSEGFNFRIGSASLASRFDNGFNGVVISKADLASGKVNRLMLAEEIQHGFDRVTAEASRAANRGLSNEQFHAEVFQRILDNSKRGKFQFLNSDDLEALSQIIKGLK